jgi:IS5 family transposase
METVVFADAGFQGADKRPEATGVKWQLIMRPIKRLGLADSGWAGLLEQAEKLKASVLRAKVEHPIRVIKREFGHVKLRYRSQTKNTT